MSARHSYHDGPCNGLPCKTALEHFDDCPFCGLSTQTPGEVRWETLREWCKSAWHRLYAKDAP